MAGDQGQGQGRDRQATLFEYGTDPDQAAIDEFDAEDASEGDASEPNPQGEAPGTGSPTTETDRPDDDTPKYRSGKPRVDVNPDTGEELNPCPWCYSDYLVEGGRTGVACGDCSAVIPTYTDWYQRGDVVRIDF